MCPPAVRGHWVFSGGPFGGLAPGLTSRSPFRLEVRLTCVNAKSCRSVACGTFLFPRLVGGGGGAFVVAEYVVVGLLSWTNDIWVKFLGVEVVELGDWFGGRAGASVGLVWWVLCALDLDTIARVDAVVEYAAFWDGDVFKRAAFEEAAFFKRAVSITIWLRATFLELAVDKEAALTEVACC